MSDVIFTLIVAVTLISALLAVGLKNVFYNALSLILCLFGVACLFVYLQSEFLAVMEVIIYIGAISIAIIFAIMLSQPMKQKLEKRSPLKVLRSTAAAALIFAGLYKIIQKTSWPEVGTQGDYSLKALGKNLLTVNALPFEVVSVILLIAIIGALLIAEKETGS